MLLVISTEHLFTQIELVVRIKLHRKLLRSKCKMAVCIGTSGELFVFTSDSFRAFKGESILRQMHFITKDGKLAGMASGSIRWLSHMLATSMNLVGVAEQDEEKCIEVDGKC